MGGIEQDELQKIILGIKAELAELGPMRPGTLSRQSRARGGTYHHLSYTHAGKGHTEYVRAGDVEAIKRELANYRQFRELAERWIEAEIALSKEKRRGGGKSKATKESGS